MIAIGFSFFFNPMTVNLGCRIVHGEEVFNSWGKPYPNTHLGNLSNLH